MKYFIKTFGCQQNVADSERIEATFTARGIKKADTYTDADYVVVNTCMVRESAENRAYGLVNNLTKLKSNRPNLKIILTGCLVGLAIRDKTGKYLQRLKEKLPVVDQFLPIDEVGFDVLPERNDKNTAYLGISNGCNNFCTYCVVPFTRGREKSRPYDEIMDESRQIKSSGFKNITLLGQNVNSYGADLLKSKKNGFAKGAKIKPTYIKHLGRLRIPTLFPYLLEQIAKMGFEKVDFISSNPWDFSDDLIDVISKNPNITRIIHLPIQSGDNQILKKMNRWYTIKEYLRLTSKIRKKVSGVKFTTDIIVGFPGETRRQFENTVKLCKLIDFEKAYISMYSARPFTAATKTMENNVTHAEKRERWNILDAIINKPKLKRKSGNKR